VNILIIGGTRFVGHHLAVALLGLDYRVTVFRRGASPDTLPPEVERLTGDRTEPGGLARAVGRRSFDAAVDMIAMRGPDTRDAVAALEGRVGRFVHVSTGQVYLVREGCPTPAREEDYGGALTPPPLASSWEHREWLYGEGKRECEDVLAEAWSARGFPAVRLRMPIIHGPRDPSGRLAGYVARIADGGPLLVPEEAGAPLRHVIAEDVVTAIVKAMTAPPGSAYNVASVDLWTHEEFVDRLAEIAGTVPRVVRLPRAELEEAGVFPACAPFASRWMSVLDGGRARSELGIRPAGFDDYLPQLVREALDGRLALAEAFAAQRVAERRLAERLGRA
jgi:nucleoside-diphosphate-sugar epimerase